jgi:protein-tyrosine phosphatase
VPGGEVDLDELYRPLDELSAFGLAGNESYLLIETPYTGWRSDIGEELARLHAVEITPVLAHPERNAAVQASPKLLKPLVEAGALVQLTASSVDGRGGRAARACAFRLLDLHLAHLIASDAHSPRVREVGLSAAVVAVEDPELGRWLTEDVPGAIVRGTEIPERPGRSRSLVRRLRRPLGD